MSNHSLLEFNHDYCPRTEDESLKMWARDIVLYMRTGDKAYLPQGVTFKHFRHHSEPDPLAPKCPTCKGVRRVKKPDGIGSMTCPECSRPVAEPAPPEKEGTR